MRPVTLVLLIMVPAVLLAVVLVLGEALKSPIERTASLEPVEHVIMGHRFRMPKAFLYFRRDFSPGDHDLHGGIMMAATVPDLAPYSEDRAWMYEAPTNYRRMVNFGLWGIKYGTGLQDRYFTPEFQATCLGERMGLRLCPDPDRDHKEIFLKIDGNRKFAWVCDRPGLNINDLCEASFPLMERLVLDVDIAIQYLPQHEAIIARIFDLMCGFYQPGGGELPTYNHCEKGTYHGSTTND